MNGIIPIKIRSQPRPRDRRRSARIHAVCLCQNCLDHFGSGYGPLEGGRLAAVVRYHRKHGGAGT